MAQDVGQQHPISTYFLVWGLLFVLSFFSYMVDYLDFQGMIRWALILIFMFLKAGFIVAIFMHVAWERRALKIVILGPPIALLVLVLLMTFEADYTFLTRITFSARVPPRCLITSQFEVNVHLSLSLNL